MLQISLFGWLCQNLEQNTTILSFLQILELNSAVSFQSRPVSPPFSRWSDRLLAAGLTGPGQCCLTLSNCWFQIVSATLLALLSQVDPRNIYLSIKQRVVCKIPKFLHLSLKVPEKSELPTLFMPYDRFVVRPAFELR